MINMHPEIKGSYSLKNTTALDAVNSKYKYEQINYFFETLYKMLHHRRIANLDQEQIKHNVAFIEIIMELIESPLLLKRTKVLQKYGFSEINSQPLIDGIKSPKINGSLFEFIAHLEWISSVVTKNMEVSLLTLLDDYYLRFPYKTR